MKMGGNFLFDVSPNTFNIGVFMPVGKDIDSSPLKVPKREIFDLFFLTVINPVSGYATQDWKIIVSFED
jgi:hypothetical protein